MLVSMIKSFLNKKFLALSISLLTAGCFSTLSYAGIVLSGTRVIYSGDQNEVTVSMKNVGKLPVLAQSWIDDGNPKDTPDSAVTPFMMTPPINRIDSGKGQTLRISLVDPGKIPRNKESAFYLNVLEIPAKPKGTDDNNHISIAFRTRIKLFYRPAGLAGDPDAAPDLIKWEPKNGGLRAFNASPYYVSLATVTYQQGGLKHVADGKMLAPGGDAEFHFSNINSIADLKSISFISINDYGASVNHNVNN